jgi:hypothetical protein
VKILAASAKLSEPLYFVHSSSRKEESTNGMEFTSEEEKQRKATMSGKACL